MDEMFAQLNRMFPNSDYVQIKKYDTALWEGRDYDSKFDSKAPMTKWRDCPLSYEEACKIAEKGWRIGWVVPAGYVIVDVDNEDHPRSAEMVKQILDDNGVLYCYNKTSRGTHFLFRNDAMNIPSDAVTKCSLGITVDHRANHKGYIILPINDPHREWGDWVQKPDDIPFYLRPIISSKLAKFQTFIGMGEGDGRNDELFKWRSTMLRSNVLANDEIALSLNMINDNLFASPLSEQEMTASVTRERSTDDEQRQSGEKRKQTILEKENPCNLIAERMTAEYNLLCIGKKQFYRYNGGWYEPLDDIEMERLIHYDISKNLPKKARDEIMEFLALKTYASPKELNKRETHIACKNGTVDLATGELIATDEDEKNTIYVPWEYKPDAAYSPRIADFMAHLARDRAGVIDERKLLGLYQIVGYCLLKSNKFQRFFIFQGEGGTGKSTFQNLIVRLVGERNRSRVGLDKFDNDYYLTMLMDKLVNIDDDVVDGHILENTGRFKSISSGEEITTRMIFKEPVTFAPFATLMFSCNKLPRINDRTSGLYRRMVIVEMNNIIEEKDPMWEDKVSTLDMEYFFMKAVQGISLAIKQGGLILSESMEEVINRFKCRQSSLNEWIYEENIRLKDILFLPGQATSILQLYNSYRMWAQDNGYQRLPSMAAFKEEMCALFKVTFGKAPTAESEKASMQVFMREATLTPSMLEYSPFGG